jgi:hypothetical protein
MKLLSGRMELMPIDVVLIIKWLLKRLKGDTLKVDLAPGGGWAAVITKK